MRNVNSDGSLNNNNANNGNSAAADCENGEHKVGVRNETEIKALTQGAANLLRKEEYRPRMQAGFVLFLLSTAAIGS